jgi:hypothetical protein
MRHLLVIACALYFTVCAPAGKRSTVGEACHLDEGTLVAVEGFLLLPNVMQTAINPENELTIYELELAAVPDDRSSVLRASVFGTRSNRTNRIAELSPLGYTQRDLQIFTDSGETVSSVDRLLVTGQLVKPDTTGNTHNSQPCILKIEKIEKP